jgi:hypothetical protein
MLKTVVGLFTDVQNVERALDELHRRGFGGGGIDIVNRDTLNWPDQTEAARQEEPAILDPLGSAGSDMEFTVPGEEVIAPDLRSSNLRRALSSIGVSREQAPLYTASVQHGGTLIIVQTEEERISEVLDIMRQADVRRTTSA